jgi:hypothetical protein
MNQVCLPTGGGLPHGRAGLLLVRP